MKTWCNGKPVTSAGDARVRFRDFHPADSDCFILDDCSMLPDEAVEYLLSCGFTGSEAQEYLNLLSLEEV